MKLDLIGKEIKNKNLLKNGLKNWLPEYNNKFPKSTSKLANERNEKDKREYSLYKLDGDSKKKISRRKAF